ncbi:MAG: mycothiol transferase [Jiangellaceae bacterium]
MEAREVLAEAYGRVGGLVHTAAGGLDADGLAYRPDPDANSIAWLVWHLTRIQDHHLCGITGREQAWTGDGWADRLGMPADLEDTGYGHTSAQVAAVRPDGPDALLGYYDAVAARTAEYLTVLHGEELARIVDRSYDPPVTVGVRLVSVISDNLQHAGQARYLRGIVDRTAAAGGPSTVA